MAVLGRLANKVAIITGAASGIGRATAFAYHKEGAKVICADIRETTRYTGSKEEENGTTHARIQDLGGAASKYGRLDIMVNHAGVSLEAKNFRPVWDIEQDVWEGTQAVNSTGVFLGTKFAVRQMLRQGACASGDRGWVINTSSILGFVGAEHTTAYCASKGAVLNFTRAAAVDCAPFRIHVNGIAPGYTQSAMTGPLWEDEGAKAKLLGKHPFRGLGQPEDIAKACVFLASEDAQWVTGHTLPVEGGYLAQ